MRIKKCLYLGLKISICHIATKQHKIAIKEKIKQGDHQILIPTGKGDFDLSNWR